jgi:hypothetical protein
LPSSFLLLLLSFLSGRLNHLIQLRATPSVRFLSSYTCES